MDKHLIKTAITQTPWHSLTVGVAMTLALSGCYVEVTDVPEHEADYDTEVTHSVADYSTQFLVRTALVPFSLSATSIEMIADPDAFLTPTTRSLARHHDPVETTSTYLFQSGPCEYGGSTGIEATGETETYADDMTFVTMDVIASAEHCGTTNWLGNITLDSRLVFDVIGWYDDAFHEIASLEGRMEGRLRMKGDYKDVNFSGIQADIVELSATDFRIDAEAALWLDDGWVERSASLETERGVHWYQNDWHPHDGKVTIEGYRGWVTLTFTESGVNRYDSDGYREYFSWSSFQP